MTLRYPYAGRKLEGSSFLVTVHLNTIYIFPLPAPCMASNAGFDFMERAIAPVVYRIGPVASRRHQSDGEGDRPRRDRHRH